MKLPTGVEIRNEKICIWFIYHGKRCREVLKGWINTSANIKKAGNLRAAIVSEINFGTFSYLSRFPESKVADKFGEKKIITTFKELTSEWIEGKKTELSQATLYGKTSKINILNKIIGEMTLIATIRYNDIVHYRNELLNGMTLYDNKKRSNKSGRTVRTVDSYISLLCTLLKYAYLSKHIIDKPFEGIKKLPKSRLKPDPLSKEEFNKLIEALHGQTRNFWQLAIYSGMRHGELCALAWEDIDLDAGTINVIRNVTSKCQFVPPKTTAGIRTITLLAPALEALKNQYQLTAQQDCTEIVYHHKEYRRTETQNVRFVFVPRTANGRQKPYYSLGGISYSWNAAIERAGVRRRNPYHTRHTYACWLLTAGANPAFIASQMGHASAQMVFDVYGAWMEEMSSDQISLLNGRLSI
ncbi:site-specific integrase [Yersinia pseudotuberculosis]|uniref:DUF3596 domain-containing protein n=1 Tax=Yersinia pseudotuberculosis TaxID=633 RepID=A0ABM7ALW0_YERPU|nr:site-specific integrase [Yersinia pseudotuberculosis]AYW93621.1 DUF3596 domain-containing protein [Yersinia pseudotuberculosis]CND30403.1 putative phage integrase [Yersinia pseudotuberculosis]SUP94386.1 putative phage integrase [Yersinia pseudotuberculosis]